MPVFNAERYIAEAIDSVLSQTFTDFELLIIDDASTDDTPDVIHRFMHDTRLRLVTQAENLGRPRTRNHGLDLARGEYIAFLDADDCCVAQRLAKQIAYLEAYADIDGVGSWMAWIDDHGQPAAYGIREFPLGPRSVACTMLAECALGQGSMMVRQVSFASYRYDTDFPMAEDYELWARMIRTCRFANVPETLTFYRNHPEQSISAHQEAQKNSDLMIYSRQLAALGVRHDEHDLARHERLLKFASRESVLKRTGAPLDIDYVRWARRWLEALHTGNTRSRIYPEPTLTHMLTARWLRAARKAIRHGSFWLILGELLKSRLTFVALRHPLRQYKYRRIKR